MEKSGREGVVFLELGLVVVLKFVFLRLFFDGDADKGLEWRVSVGFGEIFDSS